MLGLLDKKLGLFCWNIGFFCGDFQIMKKSNANSMNISWMKHSYRDRFFADPFLLSCNDDVIEVLVEEFFYNEWKGVISLLTIDNKSFTLMNRKCILDLPTHLSFPFIYREQGNIYVIPENAASGKLTMYEYSEVHKELINPQVIIDKPVVDPCITKYNGMYYLFGTIQNDSPNSNLYIYYSQHLTSGYGAFAGNPVKCDVSSSRPAGDFLKVENDLYRVTQNCKKSYGAGITLNKIRELAPQQFCEEILSEYASPIDKDYKYGFHTINRLGDLYVVDGLKYIYKPITKLKHIIFSRR